MHYEKKYILHFVILLACLILSSCQKEGLSRGLYYADTEDGVAYLELKSRHDCSMWFNPDNKNDNGFWAVQDGGINLTASAEIKIGRYTHYWYCSSDPNDSPVFDDAFFVTFHEIYRNRDFRLHFVRLK